MSENEELNPTLRRFFILGRWPRSRFSMVLNQRQFQLDDVLVVEILFRARFYIHTKWDDFKLTIYVTNDTYQFVSELQCGLPPIGNLLAEQAHPWHVPPLVPFKGLYSSKETLLSSCSPLRLITTYSRPMHPVIVTRKRSLHDT